MAVPDYPVTRREAYLNNIATGSGSIPEYPVTREESYLDAIAKNGGGGGGGGSSGSGVLVVHIEWGDTRATMDKTWQEIVDADGAVVIVSPYSEGGYETYILMSIGGGGGGSARTVEVHNSYDGPDSPMTFIADSASSYPSAAI